MIIHHYEESLMAWHCRWQVICDTCGKRRLCGEPEWITDHATQKQYLTQPLPKGWKGEQKSKQDHARHTCPACVAHQQERA